MERRLSAILAADVVGYSRLIELDEAGTLAALKTRRKEVLEPLVTRHHGRIFKATTPVRAARRPEPCRAALSF